MDSVIFLDENNNKVLDTYDDFNLLISDVSISSAEPKEDIVELPYSSKTVDFSECLFGDVQYNRRTLLIELNGRKNNEEYLEVYSQIQNLIHGQKLKIIFSKEYNFFWLGRVKINEINPLIIIRKLTITATVDPYKYELFGSLDDWLWDPFSFVDGIVNDCKDLTVKKKREVIVVGRRMHVIPIIETSTNMQVVFKNITYDLKPGINEILDIEIVEGENKLIFKGNRCSKC